MKKKITNNRLVLKNTIFLYIRQVFILFVGLYSSRVVLQVLGSTDFGVYNVVGGIATSMGFVSASMATVCQRYYAYDMVKNDEDHLNIVFNTSLFIYMVISALIVVVSETVGLWWVMNKLVIPHGRMGAALIVYHSSVAAFVVTVISTSFRAMIMAHEKMSIYAWISIFECIAKLIMVFLLQHMGYDKLIWYGLLMFGLQFAVAGAYILVCSHLFTEAKVRKRVDKLLMKEMGKFISYNLIGNFSGVVYNQGGTILANMFFGPAVNAAKSIASQVNGAVVTFAGHFTAALTPQITKNYAVSNYNECYIQLFRGIKISFFLMYVFALPLCMKVCPVLILWLGNYPDYTEEFTVLVLVSACIDVTYYLLDTLAQATGKIRIYQWVLAVLQMSNIPISYLFIKLGCKPYIILIVAIAVTIVSIWARLVILCKAAICFSIRDFFLKAGRPILLLTTVSLGIVLLVDRCFYIPDSFVGVVEMTLISVPVTVVLSYLLLLDRFERAYVKKIVYRRLPWKGV